MQLMIKRNSYILILILFIVTSVTFSQGEDSTHYNPKDTFYTSIAPSNIINSIRTGVAPIATIQLSFNYNIGHLDMAGSENTLFRKDEFVSGANFGTRYGFGVMLTGKIKLHKAGNVRLNVSTGYNRFLSNFVIEESPEGKVSYNVFSFGLGIENNFNPARKFKPFAGIELQANMISGNAVLATDSTDFDVKIKNSVRFGLSLTLGFEYAVNDKFGFNLGYRLTHANILGKKSQVSTSINETYLNDDIVNGESIPYSGWKQFMFSSFYAGVNFYIGLKNKK